MTLREILRQVVTRLSLEKDVSIEDRIVGGDVAKRLILAGNNVIRELASSYLPLVTRERVEVQDGRLDISTLNKRPVKVISIKRGHISHPFKMYPTYMYAENGVYDMEYTYLPHRVTLDEEIECDYRVSEDILANGIASEYSFMVGDMDKASLYDRKYRENLKNLSVTRKEIRIKGRLFR